MQISSINDILQGELLNSPSITSVYNVKSNAKKVSEGDLFFASNKEEITLALKNGAFAIVVDFPTDITDNEIAWIEVDDINKAVVRYLRFKLSEHELEAYFCNTASYELIKLFKSTSTPHIKLISNTVTHNLKLLDTIENGSILFCTNQTLMNAIYPKNRDFNELHYSINNLIEHSLFETSFSYLNDFFSKLRVSSLYLNEFLAVYYFFKKNVDLNRLKRWDFFKPIFIDKYFNITEYGKSDKFILVQENEESVFKEIYYIKEKYRYAKTIIISKSKIEVNSMEVFTPHCIEEIYTILQNNSFNAVYIVGYDKKRVEELFSNNNSTQPLL